MRVAKRSSLRKAKVAVARKLAVILHRRVQLVIKEGGCPRSIIEKTSFRLQAEMRSLPGRGGGGEIALGLAMLERAKTRFTH